MAPATRSFRLPGLLALLLAGGGIVYAVVSGGPGGAIAAPETIRDQAVRSGATGATLPGSVEIDAERLLEDLRILAHDSMEGRRPGSEGMERARRFLLDRFEEVGLEPAGADGFRAPFSFRSTAGGEEIHALNLLGMIRGTEHPDRFLVITAHYDHLGVRGGEVFNGADDNASGTAALLALAAHFRDEPPAHSLLFAALDAEEMGLRGARALVAEPPIPLPSVVLNVNMDMVSRSEAGELYAAGTYHYPFLAPLVREVAEDAPVTLLMGHDQPGLPPGDDWTMASDHAAFHEVGIPFLYFGVEDHPGYHDPSDTFENITPDFYVHAVTTILAFIRLADAQGEAILQAAGRAP